jgi:hypothetical protein
LANSDINSRDGFEKECLLKYNAKVFNVFSDVFACEQQSWSCLATRLNKFSLLLAVSGLPLAHILEKRVFVVHGGLFWKVGMIFFGLDRPFRGFWAHRGL